MQSQLQTERGIEGPTDSRIERQTERQRVRLAERLSFADVKCKASKQIERKCQMRQSSARQTKNVHSKTVVIFLDKHTQMHTNTHIQTHTYMPGSQKLWQQFHREPANYSGFFFFLFHWKVSGHFQLFILSRNSIFADL